MPKGPKGQKRPADVIGAAIMVAKIATGEIEEDDLNPAKEARQQGGKKGGARRAANLTPEQRAEAARLATQARWRRNQD